MTRRLINKFVDGVTMTTKTCTKCLVEKPISSFGKHSYSKDGFDWRCKECGREAAKAYSLTPAGIYGSIKGRLNFYHKKPFTISQDDFLEWYATQPQHCVYCGLKAEDLPLIEDRIINASRRLTIDCIDNEEGYVLGNLALSCMRCNYLKNDFLSSEEMLEIGPKYVRPKWDAQLNKPSTNPSKGDDVIREDVVGGDARVETSPDKEVRS